MTFASHPQWSATAPEKGQGQPEASVRRGHEHRQHLAQPQHVRVVARHRRPRERGGEFGLGHSVARLAPPAALWGSARHWPVGAGELGPHGAHRRAACIDGQGGGGGRTRLAALATLTGAAAARGWGGSMWRRTATSDATASYPAACAASRAERRPRDVPRGDMVLQTGGRRASAGKRQGGPARIRAAERAARACTRAPRCGGDAVGSDRSHIDQFVFIPADKRKGTFYYLITDVCMNFVACGSGMTWRMIF